MFGRFSVAELVRFFRTLAPKAACLVGYPPRVGVGEYRRSGGHYLAPFGFRTLNNLPNRVFI